MPSPFIPHAVPHATPAEEAGANEEPACPTVIASFRFYEELNDFIARDRRQREFDLDCARKCYRQACDRGDRRATPRLS